MAAPLLKRLVDWLWRRRPAAEPPDPLAYRVAPARGGPKGRSGAVAVEEPEDDCK